ncbi:hypothetical protein DFH27DRAFT_280456 [Peziza echinospora]|nr:hypothetical protein DFH27DRAFT_280456 [Peziza echinospora]
MPPKLTRAQRDERLQLWQRNREELENSAIVLQNRIATEQKVVGEKYRNLEKKMKEYSALQNDIKELESKLQNLNAKSRRLAAVIENDKIDHQNAKVNKQQMELHYNAKRLDIKATDAVWREMLDVSPYSTPVPSTPECSTSASTVPCSPERTSPTLDYFPMSPSPGHGPATPTPNTHEPGGGMRLSSDGPGPRQVSRTPNSTIRSPSNYMQSSGGRSDSLTPQPHTQTQEYYHTPHERFLSRGEGQGSISASKRTASQRASSASLNGGQQAEDPGTPETPMDDVWGTSPVEDAGGGEVPMAEDEQFWQGVPAPSTTSQQPNKKRKGRVKQTDGK